MNYRVELENMRRMKKIQNWNSETEMMINDKQRNRNKELWDYGSLIVVIN